MYLIIALIAPLVMFALIPGLAWFEDRMLGPQTLKSPDHATPPAPTATPLNSLSPLTPAVSTLAQNDRRTPSPPARAPEGALATAHTVRPRHSRLGLRPGALPDYRHHIARRRPPRAPIFH